MPVTLQMLGTGSAFAKTYWNNNGILSNGTTHYLLDCGITAPMAIHHLNRSFDDFAGVLITHLHGDHVGGLEEYGFQMKFKYGRKPKLIIAAALTDLLWNHTLKGGMTQEGINQLEDVFEVIAVEPDTDFHLMDQVVVRFIQTPHIPGKQSYSLLFNHTFFYSADMIFQPDLLQKLAGEGVQSIWHDCQLIEPGEVHATIKQLLTLPPEIQSIISLMHYGDNRDQYEGSTGPMSFINQHEIYTLFDHE